MAFRFTLIFLLINCIQVVQAQGLGGFQNFEYCVFVDETNVRSQPQISGRILGQLKVGEVPDLYHEEKRKKDVINDREGYWIPIHYKGQLGYVWSHTLSHFAFKSHLNVDQTFTIKHIKDQLYVQVVENNNVVYKDSTQIVPSIPKEYAACTSLGVMNHGKPNPVEIIGFNQEEYKKVLIWNGEKIDKYTQPINHPFFYKSYKTPEQFKKGIISGNALNCRALPQAGSKVVMELPLYALVDVEKERVKYDKIGEYEGWWSKIKYQEQEGYVWSNYLNIPKTSVQSHLEEGLEFVTSGRRVFAIQNGEIISHVTFSSYHNGNVSQIYLSGNGGLKDFTSLVHVAYFGESCGVPSGEYIIGWDGNKLTYLYDDFGMGDGGYYEEGSYNLPIHKNGIKDHIVYSRGYGEILAYPFSQNIDDNWKSFVYGETSYVYEFTGDSLKEVDSKYKAIRDLCEENIIISFWGDYSGDGIEDVAVVLGKEGIMGAKKEFILFKGEEDGSYTKLSKTKNIVSNDYTAIEVIYLPQGLDIHLVKSKGSFINEIDVEYPTFQRIQLRCAKDKKKLVEVKNQKYEYHGNQESWDINAVQPTKRLEFY